MLVTGAGRRLGRVIALDFARCGWRVGVHYQASAAEASALVAEIDEIGGTAAALQADLARLDAIFPLIAACAARLGPPTCLINNAACFDWDSIGTLDQKSWQSQLDVNLRAPVFLAQAFAQGLPEGARATSSMSSTRRSCALIPNSSPILSPSRRCGPPRELWPRRSPRASGSTP